MLVVILSLWIWMKMPAFRRHLCSSQVSFTCKFWFLSVSSTLFCVALYYFVLILLNDSLPNNVHIIYFWHWYTLSLWHIFISLHTTHSQNNCWPHILFQFSFLDNFCIVVCTTFCELTQFLWFLFYIFKRFFKIFDMNVF